MKDKHKLCTSPVLIGIVSMIMALAFLPVSVDSIFQSILSGVSFTINGYDVDGGTDPICWKLAWWPFSQELQLQYFNMMPACFPGTSVHITPLNLTMDENIQVLHTNTTYEFRIEAEIDYTSIARNYRKDLDYFPGEFIVGNYTSRHLLLRMILCDTTQIGFCNPLAVSFGERNGTGDNHQQLTTNSWFSDENVTSPENVVNAEQVGNHTFSPWLNLSLTEDPASPYKFGLNETIRMSVPTGHKRGSYFFIAHGHIQAHFIADNRTDEYLEAIAAIKELLDQMKPPQPVAVRDGTTESDTDHSFNLTEDHAFVWVEIADAIHRNVVEIRPPPEILTVSRPMKIGVGIASGLFSTFSLVIFGFIIRHRGHLVMKLAQWQFLLWLVGCCLVSNVFVFTYLPTRHWHCRFSDMLGFIPLTMIGCILVGRSWRVYVTLSAAMSIGLKRTSDATITTASTYVKKYCVGLLTAVARFPYNCKCSGDKDNSSRISNGFRKKVSAAETARLILWLSLPQMILQVTGAIVYEKTPEPTYDQLMTEGRELCSEGGQWVRRVGILLVAAAYATSVLLAWLSRDLPSAFNETDGIFQSAIINSIVGLMALSLDQIANMSRTSPDIIAFLWVSTSLIVTSTAIGFIVMPKVMRVRSGEEIVISNLLAQTRVSAHPSTEHGIDNGRIQKTNSAHISAENRSIHLQRNQPIPKGLERNLLGVNKLIVGVRNELVQGRTPNLKEWDQLMGKVDELHDTFQRIEFEWTEEDEKEH